tara:strand:- start:26 stop:304 length:279 start_codon:yes stop_codon:yes gene_type:complete
MRILFIAYNHEDNTLATYRQSYRNNKYFLRDFDPVKEFNKIADTLGLLDRSLLYAIDCGNGRGVIDFMRTGYSLSEHSRDNVPLSTVVRAVQ